MVVVLKEKIAAAPKILSPALRVELSMVDRFIPVLLKFIPRFP